VSEKQSILIIDDTPIILRTLSDMLKQDYNVSFAKSGEQGLEIAKTNMPDFILLDVVMPGMSGFDTLRVLKSDGITKHIPVALITGSDSEADEERGYELGAVDYIKKPFVVNVVKHRVWFNMKFISMKRALERNEIFDY